MQSSSKLLQALCSRVLHDLSGSIGAIGNCSEMLDGDNDLITSQARELVTSESCKLIQDIRFLKLMLGLDENEFKGIDEIKQDFHELLGDKTNLLINENTKDISIAVLQSILTLIKLELDSHLGDSKKFKVEINKKLVTLIVKGKSVSKKDKLMQYFSADKLKDINIDNSYVHYILCRLKEAKQVMNIMHETGTREYIIAKEAKE